MNLESIEKELKKIKLLVCLLLAFSLFVWTGYGPLQDDAGFLHIMTIGLVVYVGSSSLQFSRFQFPRFQKFSAYAGFGIMCTGFALFTLAEVVSLISIFI